MYGWIYQKIWATAIKMFELTKFASPNLLIYLNVIRSCDVEIFKLIASAQSISREVYAMGYNTSGKYETRKTNHIQEMASN